MPIEQNTPLLDWCVQYSPPAPDRVGILASTETARRAAAGLLAVLANAWPEDDSLPKVTIDHDKQALLLWLARQIGSLPALQVHFILLSSGSSPTASVDTNGILQLGIPDGTTDLIITVQP